MEILSELLNRLRVRSTSISKWTIYPESGVSIEEFLPGYFFTLISGSDLRVNSSDTSLILEPGDCLLAPFGQESMLGTTRATHFTPLAQLNWQNISDQPFDIEQQYPFVMQVTVGKAEVQPPTILLGIAFKLESDYQFLSSADFPSIIHLKRENNSLFELLQPAVEFLIKDNSAGYFAIATHIAELAVIGTLRNYIINKQDFSVGTLRALSHPKIGKVIQAIHSQAHKSWTLTSLSKLAGMSRSSFCDSFAQEVGCTPIDYLQQTRIELAKLLLKSRELSILTVALQTGFMSDRVFRQNFIKYVGMSPKEYRSNLQVE
ncbi:AraC family transcriptional regulator [Vibrio natriegens]|uniref:helix-turn-helix domain-containing protein n=1 Tax=Vibrio natriegens TaxID=691 RepID=UPI001EFCC76A|nr:AraC family transcriptional regulator [Vibrio natriegens]MCG9703295.1 AraC family transcriptional regulator [Vibrio natriegens]